MSLISCIFALWIALLSTEAATVSLGVIDNIFINIRTFEGEIQLHISWNDTILEDWNYNVFVVPTNITERLYTSCSQLSIPKDKKQAVFPNEVSTLIDNKGCIILPGNSYEVKVETSNAKVSKTKQIEIPYCVNDVCSCQHISVWPKINMTSKITDKNTVEASWTIWMPVGKNTSIFLEEFHFEKIYISISQQTNPSLTWGGNHIVVEEKLFRIAENIVSVGLDSLQGKAHFKTKQPLNPEHLYQMKAYLIDNKNCTGPIEPFVIQMPHHVAGLIGKDIQLSVKDGIIIVSFLFVCSLTLIALNYIRRRNTKNTKNVPDVMFSQYGKNFSPDTMEDNILYVDKDVEDAQYKGLADIFEVPHSAICIGPEIGVGAFGRVFKATAKNLLRMRGTTIVAVKQLKVNPTSEEIQEFLTEINMLKEVGRHHNIVSFLGCCTIRAPYMMIMEFVGRGDLLDYLRTVRSRISSDQQNAKYSGKQNENANVNNGYAQKQVKYVELKRATHSEQSYESEQAETNLRPSVTETMYTTLSDNYKTINEEEEEEYRFEYILDHIELHNFALQIANGMQFLEEQQITHRDLAARNVLIDERKTLKISDFGLSRHGIYTNTKTRKLPLRWLSIEAIRDNLYSSKSDVWAFGVVLWEIGTLGASPYPTLSNNELIPFLLSGQRLEKPEICNDNVYQLMLHCWNEDPIARPSFSDIYEKLQPKTVYVDISSISDDYVFPPIQDNI
ncbi:vascular endothelial growth factor receptor 2 [Eupeodes corollae]|uniref:vascular endothelial growth factor receptor 2 n=1 Tax=Eupeodes corollae TaxID=290404 RepID=UPI002490BF14|nr:vascular endothelial growth factor receptor 2 [Eupeodes corollae]XP_055920285.1 vascular endothelial growth factor receptor 2 [Eupeodes corollae]XP_055920286.1 vascular endothelial growth factor receptor 2 [Eupeodes corollae]